jgi:uncharacterized protein
VDPVVAVLAVLVMLVGLFGVVIPVVPGLLVVWLTSVGTTLWMGTDASGWVVAGLLTVLFAAGTAASIWLPTRQGRRGGAPRSALLSAVVGAVVGFFLLPVVGLLVGGALGFTVAEFRRYGEWRPAFRSLAKVVGAYGVGVLIELVVGVLMIGTWVIAVLLR